jgi:molybdate ABC transporter permease protein
MIQDLSPLWISLKTAAIATVITFFFGIAAARWMLGYRGKSKGFIDGILISPLVLPPTVVGFLLLLLFGRNSPVGQLLRELNINIIFTWEAAVITATVVAFPLMYRTSLGALEAIEPNLLACARTLGASEWEVFWRVMLPLSYRGIVAATILSFARALGEFGATLMLAGNIPGQTQTMPVAIFFAAEGGDMGQATLWVLIILAVSLSAIVTVNIWAEGRRQEAEGRRQKETAVFSIATSTPHTLPPIPHIPHLAPYLSINIQKQLPSFPLEIDLSADREALGLLGASGSGKSMTLRCLAGLETPDRGCISLNGKILFDSSKGINIPSYKRRIGFVFQNYALFPHLSVWENIGFGLRDLSRSEQKQRISWWIAQMHLQGLENRYPPQLSGGQQQRVALARALAIEPEALLLDEPFSALDTQLRSKMEMQLIETLATYKGVTLLVTHNLEEIYRVCRNLLVISEGKVLDRGDKQTIFSHPATYEIAQLTGCKNFSRAKRIDDRTVEAIDWDCKLNAIEPITNDLAYVGIRAHHLRFAELESDRAINSKNTFPCWLVQTSETPHRMTLYLKLNSPPDRVNDYHLQAELFKEIWKKLKDKPYPWHIRLNSLNLFLMNKN